MRRQNPGNSKRPKKKEKTTVKEKCKTFSSILRERGVEADKTIMHLKIFIGSIVPFFERQ